MSAGWWPIECAPQDGTPVDLWVEQTIAGWTYEFPSEHSETVLKRRVPDCAFVVDQWRMLHRHPNEVVGRPTHWRSIPSGPRQHSDTNSGLVDGPTAAVLLSEDERASQWESEAASVAEAEMYADFPDEHA